MISSVRGLASLDACAAVLYQSDVEEECKEGWRSGVGRRGPAVTACCVHLRVTFNRSLHERFLLRTTKALRVSGNPFRTLVFDSHFERVNWPMPFSGVRDSPAFTTSAAYLGHENALLDAFQRRDPVDILLLLLPVPMIR